MKAVFLLIATNLGVMAVLSLVLQILGINQMLNQSGMNMQNLLIYASIYGFAGSFISLLMSKNLAKRQMRVQLIDAGTSNPSERWLYDTVKRQAEKSGVGMPEVGIFQQPAPNAFATGHNKDAALVAVSTGLLQHMNADEIEAVLGHEMAHVKNGDMVTSALIQGTINAFVIVFASLISSLLARGNRRQSGAAFHGTYMLLQMLLGFLGSMVVMWHSRHREFTADRGGAELAGKHKMIAALRRLEQTQAAGAQGALAKDFKAFGIVPMSGLFSTHPPLAKRIAALEQNL
ncbi:protease HtpX [Suttonella indologenes]|uniref:Protease HtpX n=1 Tax=Suttonella indologenes TaxID=13276 RepID=A0A380MYV0_9GAMM|nr:protease HtpX [Suttonella indologenes]SUO97394.1 Protease HtpX [Suttonella indologenes]